MNKRMLPVLMASLLLATSIAGCSGNNNQNANTSSGNNASASEVANSAEPGQIDFNEEPYTIKVNYAVLGQEQPDLPKIEEKLNEITLKEINAKVDLEGVSLYNMANVYALKASSNEKTDLMLLMPGNNYFVPFVNNKMVRPIDDELAEWGSSIKDSLGNLLQAGQFNGKQYAIPQKLEQKNTFGFNMNKSILDKYNIDINSIKSMSDMDPIFAKIHENEPNMTVLAPEVSSSNIASTLVYSDGLGNQYGALMDDGSTKLTNVYESDEWVNSVKKVREWYEKGYISKDVSTSQDDGSTLLDKGKVFATASASVGFAHGSTQPIVKKAVTLHPAVRSTTDSQLFMWTVSSSSKRPDKAIQLLNLFDSKPELSTLLLYGIEGEHYEVNTDGTVDTSKNGNYQNYWYMFGDYEDVPLSEANVTAAGLTPEEYNIKLKEWNDQTTESPGYGFIFDPTPVKTEVAALDAVSEQYLKVIGNGAVESEKMIKTFNDSLYSAGLQKVIDEKQKQLDTWLANKGS